ncbi:hypothetical protein [Nocardia amamiensis]|uniref:hypothetical protein n=1 Tax=Nocardia TaxID=1817 RepID=UPI00340C9313
MIACDGLCTRPLDAMELRAFLRRCFEVPESEIFVSRDDLVDESLRDVQRDGPFAVYCTYRPVGGDFAAAFSLSADPSLSGHDAPDSQEFVVQLAAQIGCDFLCSFGDERQPWLWTLTRSDGARVLVHLDEDVDGFDGEPRCPCEYAHRKVVYPKS